jgi:hypothetical protein
MLDAKFSYASFVSAAPQGELTSALASEIERRLRASKDPRREMRIVVEELRQMGHEIWSFDASIDWESFTTWGKGAEKLEWDLSIFVTYSAPQAAEVIFRKR